MTGNIFKDITLGGNERIEKQGDKMHARIVNACFLVFVDFKETTHER